MRTCKVCSLKKSEQDFYISNKASCKECVCKRIKQYRRDDPEKIRSYDRIRSRSPHRREANKVRSARYLDKDYKRNWIQRNQEKRSAHILVGNSLKNGSLVRPDQCERCGGKCTPEAHHEDYSKPLDVDWLCTSCHGERHRELNEMKRIQAA